jgi:hypothetical protein
LRHFAFQTIVLAIAAGLYFNVLFDFAWWLTVLYNIWNWFGLFCVTGFWIAIVVIKDEYLKTQQISPKQQSAMDTGLEAAISAYSNKFFMVYDIATDWCLFGALYHAGYTTFATFQGICLLGQYGVMYGMKQTAREYISSLKPVAGQPVPGSNGDDDGEEQQPQGKKPKYRSIDDQ